MADFSFKDKELSNQDKLTEYYDQEISLSNKLDSKTNNKISLNSNEKIYFINEENFNAFNCNDKLFRKKKPKNKKVHFLESNFVQYINVESYKKYNSLNVERDPFSKGLRDNKADVKCICFIF